MSRENIFLGEIQELKNAYDCLDLDWINQFIYKIIKCDVIYLNHPFLDNVVTKVRNSIRFKEINAVFLSDEDGGHKWCFIQATNFIDAIIVDEELYFLHDSTFQPKIYPAVDDVISVLREEWDLKFNMVFGGFIIKHKRPFHYIYDFLRNVHFFRNDIIHFNKKVISEGGEFIPLKEVYGFNFHQAHNEYYLFPTSLQAFKAKSLRSKNVNEMEKHILSKVEPSKASSADVVIWIGITGQKRSWIEQIDGYSNIINEISNNCNSVLLYIDGMTSCHNQSSCYEEDDKVYKEIKGKLNSNVFAESLIGLDYFTKISFCRNIDFFISNGGSGSIVPDRICRKNGVMHSSRDFWTFGYQTSENASYVSKRDIIDLSIHSEYSVSFRSYFIDWKIIFNMILDSPSLPLSSVSKFDNAKSTEVLNTYYKEVFRFILLDSQDFSSNDVFLQKIADRFESIGDIETTISILKIAYLFNLKNTGLFRKIEKLQKLI